jgi:hypothetical protein
VCERGLAALAPNVGIRIVADCERKTIDLPQFTNVAHAFELPTKRLLFLYFVSRSVFIFKT